MGSSELENLEQEAKGALGDLLGKLAEKLDSLSVRLDAVAAKLEAVTTPIPPVVAAGVNVSPITAAGTAAVTTEPDPTAVAPLDPALEAEMISKGLRPDPDAPATDEAEATDTSPDAATGEA